VGRLGLRRVGAVNASRHPWPQMPQCGFNPAQVANRDAATPSQAAPSTAAPTPATS